MTRRRFWSAAPALLVVLLALSAAASADPIRVPAGMEPKALVPVPDPPRPDNPWPDRPWERRLDIQVWVRGGDGRIFYPGEPVTLYFRTSRDAFVLLYDIDTEGRVHRLYPRSPWDREFVTGGVTYAVPARGAGYRLVAAGPPGEEFVVAMASDVPLVHRWDGCWDGVAGYSDYDRLGDTRVRMGRVKGDRGVAMDRLERKLVEIPDEGEGWDRAIDRVSFYIGRPQAPHYRWKDYNRDRFGDGRYRRDRDK